MRPGKLYIKIFLSFIVVLIVTELMIFGLFVRFMGRHFHSRVERYVNAQSSIVRQYVEEKLSSEPEKGAADNRALRRLILDMGRIYGAKVWLTGPNGDKLIRSFEGELPPEFVRFQKRRSRHLRLQGSYHSMRKGFVYYIRVPVDFPGGETGRVHLLFERKEETRPEGAFALGLLAIGLVIALLIIPVSRRITNPVKRLKASALRIAEGDLSHRADVKTKDEIGELGRSFNHMAERLERMIRGGRELTANISHELRSPLARMRVAEELLREKAQGEGCEVQARYLDDIRQDIEELDRLIGRILELSKLDIKEEPLTFETFDVSSLIEGMVERLRPAAERKGLALMTQLSFDDPISGDREAVKTALSNIFDNALKFTAESGRVMIQADRENGLLRIAVTNSFEKLSPEELSGMFEPFFRIEQSPVSGSGLGLAIAAKIVERHGGTIEALNSEEGLRIEIRLPLSREFN